MFFLYTVLLQSTATPFKHKANLYICDNEVSRRWIFTQCKIKSKRKNYLSHENFKIFLKTFYGYLVITPEHFVQFSFDIKYNIIKKNTLY